MTQSILVTGSSRGIGRAIAVTLGKAGYTVVVHYRSRADEAQQVIDEICSNGGNARLLQFDVGDRAATADALLADTHAHGAYYGVVCNAGIARDNAFPAMSGDDWDAVIHTNLDAFYNVLHPITMPMLRMKQGGRIVTLASVSGVMGNRGQVNYSAAKAGIMGATKALAVELAKRKVTVNCVAPGIIATEMTAELRDEAMQMVPLRRAGEPQEVADLVAFLVSDKAAYITRQVISINGGMF
ncbi:3-ketoacyl-ACP reductase FabG2 [Teredinibacter turnerae]|uniref:3-ketoacyl-ACP reductase FabG2 n=1 Tax=Teredinibacter turnerae TaxID=2426 RepID=UPI000367D0F5|nr:3-ketoacyl-ACP reductase FabG2 [Teredinibacter turnerae]